MSCPHCADTGSLSKDPDEYLDCGYCDVAQERAAFEAAARKQPRIADLWLAYQRGKADARLAA